MTVPFTFATSTSPIPLANLDANFAAVGNATGVTYTAPFTGGVAETVSAKLAQIVSVMDFGAVGDGVTNDTAAIQAAIAAVTPVLPGNPWDLNGNAGGTVYLPQGKYLVSPDSIVVPSWVNLKGAGKSSSILFCASAGVTVVSIGTLATPSYHASIVGLTIFGNYLNVTGLSIYASYWMTNDVEVTKCNHNGIYTYSSYTGKAYNTYLMYNATSAGYAGILCDGAGIGTGTNDVTFFGGSIGNCYDGIRLNNGNGIYIDSVSIQSSFRIGVNIQGQATSVTIVNCYFEDNVTTYSGSSIYGAFNYVTIQNNYFANTGAQESKYIAGSAFNGVKIINNTFGNTTPSAYIGLVDESASSVIFLRNLIEGNAGPSDSIPLFTSALKAFVDNVLYAVNDYNLSRVDHLQQYFFQTSNIFTYNVTFTPSTSGTITLDSSSNLGAYTKIDKLVHVQGALVISSVSSPTGSSVQISLPFPIADLSQNAEQIGGAMTQNSSLVAFSGNGLNSYFNMLINASTVSAGQVYRFSFSYISS